MAHIGCTLPNKCMTDCTEWCGTGDISSSIVNWNGIHKNADIVNVNIEYTIILSDVEHWYDYQSNE